MSAVQARYRPPHSLPFARRFAPSNGVLCLTGSSPLSPTTLNHLFIRWFFSVCLLLSFLQIKTPPYPTGDTTGKFKPKHPARSTPYGALRSVPSFKKPLARFSSVSSLGAISMPQQPPLTLLKKPSPKAEAASFSLRNLCRISLSMNQPPSSGPDKNLSEQ
jgi:hypothetical protein